MKKPIVSINLFSLIKDNDNPDGFEESGKSVITDHEVLDPRDITDPSASVFIRSADLIALINSVGGAYQNTNYQHYLFFSITGGTLSVALRSPFTATGNYYSVPLIRTLITTRNVVSFNFYTAIVGTQARKMIFSTLNGTGGIKYYDFSDHPT